MKRESLVFLAAFFSMSLLSITGVYAVEEANKPITVAEKKIDITGDGVEDTIYLKEEPVEKEGHSRNIYLEIVDSSGEKHNIKLGKGLKSYMEFGDLNQDGIKDLFVTISTEDNDSLSKHYLYTLKENKVVKLSIPEPLVLQSQLLDDYKGQVRIDEVNETFQFDLKDRAEAYEELGLYQNGRLNEPFELIVQPSYSLSLEPIKKDMLGLKGVQRLSGTNDTDLIACVESIWTFEKGKWSLKETKVTRFTSNQKNKQ